MNWISHLELSKLIDDAHTGLRNGDQRKLILANIYKDKYIKIAKEFNISEDAIREIFFNLNKSINFVSNEFSIIEKNITELKNLLERAGTCAVCGVKISRACDLIKIGSESLCFSCVEWSFSKSKI